MVEYDVCCTAPRNYQCNMDNTILSPHSSAVSLVLLLAQCSIVWCTWEGVDCLLQHKGLVTRSPAVATQTGLAPL